MERDVVYERTISDLMEDKETILKGFLNSGKISRDEYLDQIENLRESVEKENSWLFEDDEEEEDISFFHDSDWDYLQEYLEAF